MGVLSTRLGLLLTCLLFCQHVSAELQGRCPAESRACPARASPCEDDNACENQQICCDSQCGKTCVDPLYTGCENVRLSSERISRALAAENSRGGRGMIKTVRSPRCRTSDGEFEEIQCDNEIVSSCWCVDPTGFEIAGTRAPAAALVNCTGVAPCAAHTCRMLCPLGFELDPKGCPMCKCRDPCTTITCPGQLSCQLEETPCLRPPCPPVPTCKRGRSLQNICPAGEPLLISETSRPFLCGTDPGKPNCPPLYRCLVEKGNDYGVCCPASLELQKAGTCPALDSIEVTDCGTPCAHDLECPSMQKCCDGGDCGRHCALPNNVTACTQQKMLAELLVVSEREGKGYVPQCGAGGTFEPRQCSRNGLVCWCVDSEGNKIRGTMGPSPSTKCVHVLAPPRSGGRSLDSSCTPALCAGVCEYGYVTGAEGCPTCECDDPCEGYPCGEGEECIRVKDAECSGDLCTGYPVCRPRISYENPCETGTPATDDSGSLITCGLDQDCPSEHSCMRARRSGGSICCPLEIEEAEDSNGFGNSTGPDNARSGYKVSCSSINVEALCSLNTSTLCTSEECPDDQVCCGTETCGVCVDANNFTPMVNRVDDTPTMCEYLRDFDEKMEGTVDGMGLAIPAPRCLPDGSYASRQCDKNKRCWCVDSFGTPIPETDYFVGINATVDCAQVRKELSCLDLTCRMGCDYGFELGTDKCPTCRCRDPCSGVQCPTDKTYCALVDVACDADYCPPVPACLPNKPGQCPYLVPLNGACEWACKSDSDCEPDSRCCATGCGTSCAKALLHTACGQRRALALYTAAETGRPPAASWVPDCTAAGLYQPIQCRTADKVCWCSDNVGNEIHGTRVTNSTPTCDAPAVCPPANCEDTVQCPYGPELDGQGCPTCSCKDPCAEANCRSDETCVLVPLDCYDKECPPVGRCLPSPECPWGTPLRSPEGSGALRCGPHAAACPSSHACRFAPHDSRPPVCCPKPRTVCFESRDEGTCAENNGLNTTRWYFNHERNRCERFIYHGCSGNHNNFQTKDECNSVCPVEGQSAKVKSTTSISDEVLSPCERLREKNEQAAEKYGKGTFIPKCDATGTWEPVQCMQHIDVCWCVNGRGEPLKGSLVRGAKPTCNFRQARKWIRRDPLDEKAKADEVLEELIRQMTAYRIEEFEEEDTIDSIELQPEGRDTKDEDVSTENITTISEIVPPKPAESVKNTIKPVEVSNKKLVFKTKCQLLQEEVENGAAGLRPRCMSDGSFSPRQCARGRCWCVDAAGHRKQHPNSVPDLPEPDTCEHTQIESASLEIEIVGADSSLAEKSRSLLSSRLSELGTQVGVAATAERGVLRLRAMLAGPRAVDVVYHIETMIKQEKLKGLDRSSPNVLGADVIRTEYRLAVPAPAMQQREILTESTVSATTSYHTALIVLAATSAFIISVLCVLVMLYRARLQREPHKAERFLPAAPPVYVLSADEKAELARVLHAPPPPVPPMSCTDDLTRV